MSWSKGHMNVMLKLQGWSHNVRAHHVALLYEIHTAVMTAAGNVKGKGTPYS